MYKREIFIFFGPPGSGKGTQIEKLAQKINLPVISTGKLIREEISKKTDLGILIKKSVDNGELLDDDIIFSIVKNKLGVLEKGVILDGFPRTKIQLEYLLSNILLENDKIYAILINVSDEEVISRLGGRRSCACGASYHIKYKKPKKENICDLCGLELFIRDDEKIESIEKRLEEYYNNVSSMLDYWKKNNNLIEINGDQTIDEVNKDIFNYLNF